MDPTDNDITLRVCVVCVCSKPPVINKVVSVCLNHAAPCSWVNIRVNGKDSYSIVSVFSVRPLILNNNDFLMWTCDYIVMVKYGSSWPHWKLGPKCELLQQHRLQQYVRWGNLHKFKSNLNRASSVSQCSWTLLRGGNTQISGYLSGPLQKEKRTKINNWRNCWTFWKICLFTLLLQIRWENKIHI